MHYRRWQRTGDPAEAKVRVYASVEESFVSQIAPGQGGCIVWTGGLTTAGYGQIRFRESRVRAHRYAWERVHGPIPEGMHVDHRCWNHACCNPAHLRLATHKQNMENRSGPDAQSTSGVRGVHWSKALNKWRGYVGHNGKSIHVGVFHSIDEAADAVRAKRAELFTHSQN